jgi:hypothetical protein
MVMGLGAGLHCRACGGACTRSTRHASTSPPATIRRKYSPASFKPVNPQPSNLNPKSSCTTADGSPPNTKTLNPRTPRPTRRSPAAPNTCVCLPEPCSTTPCRPHPQRRRPTAIASASPTACTHTHTHTQIHTHTHPAWGLLQRARVLPRGSCPTARLRGLERMPACPHGRKGGM